MKQNYLKQMLSRDKHYRSAFVLAVAVPLICAAAAALILRTMNGLDLSFFKCSIKQVTGFHCVSCGATHATFALLRGDIAAAVYYNPLYIVFLCWLMYLYVRLVISLFIRPYHRYVLKLDWKSAIIIAVIIFSFTIIRNFPFYQALFY